MSNWGPTPTTRLGRLRATLSRPRLLVAGAALGAVALVGGGGFMLLGQHHVAKPVAQASSRPSPSPDPTPTPADSPSPSPLASPTATGTGVAPAGYYIKPKPPIATLTIPSLGISGQVLPVDLAKDGSMGVTNQSYNMGWWDRGPLPGQPGDSVIGGHLDWYDTPHAIFFNLKNIAQGADIFVKRSDGTSYHFVVYQVRNVAYNSSLPDLFSPAGPPRLTLITCGGVFNARTQNYSNRVLVDAHLA